MITFLLTILLGVFGVIPTWAMLLFWIVMFIDRIIGWILN